MLQKLDLICGKHCNCYLVKDTINKWEPFLWLIWANSHHSFNSGHQPNIVKGESYVCWMSSLLTLFIPLGTRVDLYQIITCLFLFYLPVSSICFLHNIFLVLFLLRRKEIVRKRGENTPFFMWGCLSAPVQEELGQISFLSCFQRNSCQVPICQFCRRFNSSNGEKSEGVSFMAAGGWKAKAGCSVLMEVLSITFSLIFIIWEM